MGWATAHIAKLKDGETVSFRPRGNSMSPKIRSGQLCTVEPVDPSNIEVGDIVLCKVKKYQYLHLVKAIQGDRFRFHGRCSTSALAVGVVEMSCGGRSTVAEADGRVTVRIAVKQDMRRSQQPPAA